MTQCWVSVAEGGPTSDQHWINVFCLLYHNVSTQCWCNVGQPSVTLAQHYTKIGLVFSGIYVESNTISGLSNLSLRHSWIRTNQGCVRQPFKPSRCIKASFYIPENRLNFAIIKGFRMNISMNLAYQYMVIFFNF